MREIPTQNLVRSLKVFSFRVLVEVEIPHSNPGPFAPGAPGRVGGRRGRPARAAPALPCNLFRTMSGIPPPNLVRNLKGFSFRFWVEVEIPNFNVRPHAQGCRLLELLGRRLRCRGVLLGGFGMGASWGVLRGLGRPWWSPERVRRVALGILGESWGGLGWSWDGLGGVLGGSWVVLGGSTGVL